MATFKQQVELLGIPSIRRMLSKECEHLQWLRSQQIKRNLEEIDKMIGLSKKVISHLQERLFQYEEYVKLNSDQNPEWSVATEDQSGNEKLINKNKKGE